MIQRISSSTSAVVVQAVVFCFVAIEFVALNRFANAQALPGGPASPASNTSSTITQPAQLQPYEQAEILAKAAGFVSRVHVDIGERVEKDQMLAELWIPEMEQERLVAVATVDEAAAVVRQMEAAVIAAESMVEAAKAKLHEAQANVAKYQADVDFRRSERERIAQLVGQRALNEALLDEKESQLRSSDSALTASHAGVTSAEANVQVESARSKQANANLSHAQARRKLAEANLKKTEVLMSYAQVRAPFDGLVTHRGIDTGDFVASAASSATEPMFTVASVDRLRIIVDIPESQAPLIRVGQKATLVVDAVKGRSFQGAVKRNAGVLDRRTRTLRVEAELDSPADELRPGMFGSLTIELAPTQAGR